jgi:hypothetical protein
LGTDDFFGVAFFFGETVFFFGALDLVFLRSTTALPNAAAVAAVS